jgi:5'-nucleotidase
VSWILLTNDDGPESPALAPFARALSRVGEIRVVVPDRERSWIGKAITRFEPVTVRQLTRDGIDLWTCSGYPADGVQLGIHGLFEESPRLVVSGINVGYNHGVGFLTSSGTVGACMEAWVSGLPSIAFSTGSMGDWEAWKAHAHSPEAAPAWERLAGLCAELATEIEVAGLVDVADIVSVNLPFDAQASTPRRVTTIARVGYDRLFRPEGEGRFVHDFGGGVREFAAMGGTDVDAARRGWVSITPIRMLEAAAVPDEVRRAVER